MIVGELKNLLLPVAQGFAGMMEAWEASLTEEHNAALAAYGEKMQANQ